MVNVTQTSWDRIWHKWLSSNSSKNCQFRGLPTIPRASQALSCKLITFRYGKRARHTQTLAFHKCQTIPSIDKTKDVPLPLRGWFGEQQSGLSCHKRDGSALLSSQCWLHLAKRAYKSKTVSKVYPSRSCPLQKVDMLLWLWHNTLSENPWKIQHTSRREEISSCQFISQAKLQKGRGYPTGLKESFCRIFCRSSLQTAWEMHLPQQKRVSETPASFHNQKHQVFWEKSNYITDGCTAPQQVKCVLQQFWKLRHTNCN